MNFRERQHLRWQSAAKASSTVGSVDKKHTAADKASGDAGSRHLYTYEQSRAANEGHHWADHDVGVEEGHFQHTNGVFPDVKNKVKSFEDAANYTGGFTQPGFYTSDPAPGVARASIKKFAPRYEIQNEGAGKTFEDRQHQRWSGKGGG